MKQKTKRHEHSSAWVKSAKMVANGIQTHTRTTRESFSGWCEHGFESHSQPFLLT